MTALALALCVLLPVQATARDGSDAGTAAAEYALPALDVIVLRPLGLVALVVGGAAFVPAAILTAPGGRDAIGEAFDVFVTPGYEFVFERQLGGF